MSESNLLESLKAKPKEFGGILGSIFLVLFLPIVVWVANSLIELPTSEYISYFTKENLATELIKIKSSALDFKAWFLYLGWLAWICLCWTSLPGNYKLGLALRNGDKLNYRLNAKQTALCTLIVLASRFFIRGSKSFLRLESHFSGMMIVSFIIAHIVTLYTYINARTNKDTMISENTRDNVIYDYWIGRPLNPRIGEFDIKEVLELRPGLLLWIILDFVALADQYNRHGYITDSLVLVCLFQTLFVLDACWIEEAVLTTMDITTDGFGFMLAFGNLTWVPFLYTLQARYLARNPVNLGWTFSTLIVILHFTGYYIFRSANSQKNKFRSNPLDPDICHLGYMETEAGSKLLTTGWWGAARHINYFGDWLIGWSFCLPCGFSSPLPYFYMVYFTTLLLHREKRDEAKCMKKYGQDWTKYKSLVPYRFIPGVY